jgi:3',5'-nucleoside bisphosphate phosphatase
MEVLGVVVTPIDLHMHSLFSDDGDHTPEELVDRAQRQGVQCMALTDHNGTRGVAAAVRRGLELGLEVIPGIEIDCQLEGANLHVLGYYIDHERSEFAELEADITAQEMASFTLKVEALRRLGLEVDEEPLLAEAQGKLVGTDRIILQVLQRPGAADIPMLRPYLRDGEFGAMPIVHFWWDFFAQGRPAYVPMRFMSLEEAIALVRSSGGVPVLAHPGAHIHEKPELLEPIQRAGIHGLEVFSNYHDAAQRSFYLSEAQRLGLVPTCGSDFHGRVKPGIEIGGHGADLDGEAMLLALQAGRG